ncbi:MAG: hypothetical protein PHW10_04585 [Candidatus Peribacteraceae bacterium]|nr:hypothetical protein [Candidatus Peribacteraceae bacterium]
MPNLREQKHAQGEYHSSDENDDRFQEERRSAFDGCCYHAEAGTDMSCMEAQVLLYINKNILFFNAIGLQQMIDRASIDSNCLHRAKPFIPV